MSKRGKDRGSAEKVAAIAAASVQRRRPQGRLPLSHAQNDHFAWELTPFERIVRLDRHPLHPISFQFPNFATEPYLAGYAPAFSLKARRLEEKWATLEIIFWAGCSNYERIRDGNLIPRQICRGLIEAR